MTFTLPNLNYAYDALQPHIDAMTMEIHHTKHHGAYVTNLNNAIQGTEWEGKSIEQILWSISKLSPVIRNNGGWHYNHSMFREIIGPNAGGAPDAELATAIDTTFGSFATFKEMLANEGMKRFGSGWAWLIVQDGKLVISSTPNQDNPLMDDTEVKGFPILWVDVREHAYYLKYQNRRADYLAAFWNVVNWKEVEKRFMAVK